MLHASATRLRRETGMPVLSPGRLAGAGKLPSECYIQLARLMPTGRVREKLDVCSMTTGAGWLQAADHPHILPLFTHKAGSRPWSESSSSRIPRKLEGGERKTSMASDVVMALWMFSRVASPHRQTQPDLDTRQGRARWRRRDCDVCILSHTAHLWDGAYLQNG
jgi:hypothetical protein